MIKLKKYSSLAICLTIVLAFALSLSACGYDEDIPLAQNVAPARDEYPTEPTPQPGDDENDTYPESNGDEPEPEPQTRPEINHVIEVFWATDEFLEWFDSAYEFVEVDDANQRWVVSYTRDLFGWDEASSRKIAFISDRDMRFHVLEAGFLPHHWSLMLSVSSLYSEWLNSDTPLIITWDDWMVLPYRFIGIQYYDNYDIWTERVFEVIVQDNDTVSLVEVNDLYAILNDAFEFDVFLAWGGSEYLVGGAEPPVTQVVGFFDDPQMEWETISVSAPDTWFLAWHLMRRMPDIDDDARTVELAEEVEEMLLTRFADYFVMHDYPWYWADEEITLPLPEETARRVHYLLATMPAFELLQPRHSGHPLHACCVLLIRIEFTDGTMMALYVAEGFVVIKKTGTYTWHGDPGIVMGGNEELVSILLNLFMD